MERARTLALALIYCSAAQAHTERFPKRDKLEIAPGAIVLTLDYAIPQGGDARTVREIFDRDHSGAFDDGERQAIARYLADQAAHFVALTLDDRALTLERSPAELELAPGADGRVSVRLTLSARTTPSPGKHTLKLADRHKDRRIAVPLALAATGVALDAGLPPEPLLDEKHPILFTFTYLSLQ